MSAPYKDRRRGEEMKIHTNPRKEEMGVEISLSPRSNVDLENRYEWTDSSSNADGSDHHHANDFGAFVNDRRGRKPKKTSPWGGRGGNAPQTSSRSRQQRQKSSSWFRKMIWLLLMFCVGAIIAASVMAVLSKKNQNKTNMNASQLSTNTNGGSTSAPASTPTDGSSSSSGTASPSGAPIAAESSATMGPTPTQPTYIRPVKTSFAWGEGITFFFSYGPETEAQPDDWIGLYPADAVDADSSSLAFLFLCNRTTICSEAVSVGKVTFADRSTDSSSLAEWGWPLDPGNYRAFILRGFQAPFEIVANSTAFGVEPDFWMHQVVPTVRAAQSDIRDLIDQDETLGPKFVRLAFHDCVGGCDGCVDLEFHDNFGLDIPIDALQPIVEQYESKELGISRADIWAMSSFLGADVAQRRSDTKVDFSLEFIGRKNCEDIFSQCFDKDGVERACSATLGPHVTLPLADITTEDMFHFFSEEFDFSVQEVVALMGAHTIGSLAREHSGFHGPNGWVRDNLLLDNDYYHELVGGEPGDSSDDLVDLAPPWLRFEVDNSDLGEDNRPAWRAFPPALDGDGTVEIVMLNADIALVRELTTDNMQSNGRVSCSFTQRLADDSGSPRCPAAERSLQFAADYKFDNDLWLNDFEAVYKKLLNHGYNYDPFRRCPGRVCAYEDDLMSR